MQTIALLKVSVTVAFSCLTIAASADGLAKDMIQVTRDIGDEHCWNSSRLAFNANATRLFVVRPSGQNPDEVGGRPAIYDMVKQQLRWCSEFGFHVHWGMVWDRRDPDVIYGVNATKVMALNVATNDVRVVVDFAEQASFHLTRVFHPSLNEAGDRIMVQGRAQDGSWQAVLTAKLDGTDVHEIRYEAPSTQRSGHSMFTRTASYLSIGAFRGQGGHVLVNYDGTNLLEVPDAGGHGAFSPSGDLVYSRPYDFQKPGYLLTLPLLQPSAQPRGVFSWDFTHPTSKGPMPISKFQNHISWNHNDPTWFILSGYTQQNKLQEGWPRLQIIYKVYVDGQRPPELLYECPEPLLWQPEQGPWIHYWAQGLASTSRDGKWIVFSSSKDHPTQQTGVNVYLLQVHP